MKVLLHYEDNGDTELWKSLKITLPKSWKNGPTSKLLAQFVESYNSIETLGGGPNPLTLEDMHLVIRQQDTSSKGTTSKTLQPLASDAVILDCIPDRADVYVVHGKSQSLQDIEDAQKAQENVRDEHLKQTAVACTRFGCNNRFPKGGPYPPCQYHKSPPVFHETAKFWSCCPNKKAYDWDDFQNIPGCQTADACTDVKENENTKQFLGGTDLREQAGAAAQLKSIDDFNKAQAAGGSDAAPVLERFQNVLEELGVENELFNQVVDGMQREFSTKTNNEAELLEAIKAELGSKLKATLKAIAADQLRIK